MKVNSKWVILKNLEKPGWLQTRALHHNGRLASSHQSVDSINLESYSNESKQLLSANHVLDTLSKLPQIVGGMVEEGKGDQIYGGRTDSGW